MLCFSVLFLCLPTALSMHHHSVWKRLRDRGTALELSHGKSKPSLSLDSHDHHLRRFSKYLNLWCHQSESMKQYTVTCFRLPRYCQKRNVSLNVKSIDWRGLYARTDNGVYRVASAISPPYSRFTLTVCHGSCQRDGKIENRVNFPSVYSKILARLDPRVSEQMGLEKKPCCIPSAFEKEETAVRLMFKDRGGESREGTVRFLRNALRCMCE